ncbi:MAG: MoaD/ThiS family protein [Pirellulaceae bacterium]|jgi:molybdopterin converting factor small subunit|nr:MoaD/ThiS family protein [Pirellulaceae bacterium]
MAIRVEFYGVPRQRAGVSSVELPARAEITLGAVLTELAGQFPELAVDCISGESLQRAAAVSLDGDRFVRDPATLLSDGQCLLLLSADAGG